MQNMQNNFQYKAGALALLEKFLETSPKEAALILESIPLNEAVFWASSLKAQSIIIALENMTPKKAAVLLRRLPFKQAAHIVLGLNTYRAGELILALPPHYKKKLTDNLEPSLVSSLEKALTAPQGTVARLMSNNHFTFKTDAKIKDIINKLKPLPKNRVPYAVYIIDKAGRPGGIIKTAELALYSQDAAAGSVMLTDFDRLAPMDKEDAAFELFKTSNALMLPVVDGEGFLAGTLSLKQVMRDNKTGAVKLIRLAKGLRRRIVFAFIFGFFTAFALYLFLVWMFV